MTQFRNPHTKYPVPPFPEQEQNVPGTEAEMEPKADHDEELVLIRASAVLLQLPKPARGRCYHTLRL